MPKKKKIPKPIYGTASFPIEVAVADKPHVSIFRDQVDPIHASINLMDQLLTAEVWKDKYRYGDEQNPIVPLMPAPLAYGCLGAALLLVLVLAIVLR